MSLSNIISLENINSSWVINGDPLGPGVLENQGCFVIMQNKICKPVCEIPASLPRDFSTVDTCVYTPLTVYWVLFSCCITVMSITSHYYIKPMWCWEPGMLNSVSLHCCEAPCHASPLNCSILDQYISVLCMSRSSLKERLVFPNTGVRSESAGSQIQVSK